MSIYLLRHGATLNNVMHITQSVNNDIRLTDEALEELRLTAQTMITKLSTNITIVCSPMLRARETASILTSKLCMQVEDLHIIINDDLKEVDFGDFGDKHELTMLHGTDMEYYRKATMQYYIANADFTYPNGESMTSVHNRCQRILAYLQSIYDNADNDIIIIGHNRLFRHLLVESKIWLADNMFNEKLPHAKLIKFNSMKHGMLSRNTCS